MRVLQVTNARSSFFENQLRALDSVGVDYDVASPATGVDGDRTALDYLRFYPDLLGTALAGYDVIHANYGLVGPLALAQPQRPLVLSLWGSDVMGDHSLVTGLSRLTAARADAVIAPSRTLATTLDDPPYIVPFGIDTEQFRPVPRARAREAVGWPQDETIALFPYEPDRAVKRYDLAESVVAAADVDVTLRTLHGVPYEEMPLYLNASDVVLVTSEREAGPMIVKEAAACDVPVVATDVGFTREVLADRPRSTVATTESALAGGLERALAMTEENEPAPAVDSIESMGNNLRAIYERVSR